MGAMGGFCICPLHHNDGDSNGPSASDLRDAALCMEFIPLATRSSDTWVIWLHCYGNSPVIGNWESHRTKWVIFVKLPLVIYHRFAILNGSYINLSCLIEMIPTSQRRRKASRPCGFAIPSFLRVATTCLASCWLPKQVSMDWFRENLQETMVLPWHIGFPVKFPIIQFCDSNPQHTVMGANLLETIDALWLSLSTILKDHRMSRRYCESSTSCVYFLCKV